jgi:hypothetical protein
MIRVIAIAARPLRAPSTVVARTLGIFAAGLQFCRNRMPDVFDGYQPERHYMRGPGPKWYAKHPDADSAA